MENVTHDGAVIATCISDDVCEVVQCEVCMTEVPASASHGFEVVDYVHHFCGLECLGLWREKLKVKDGGIQER
ncbi:hypothetical protein SKTS_24150 [Sulfurimicrobium lacus]|uniref:TRASH domain-containing protein n=1 Tax=Sulfurimicrobium lacus TaxID=2715678 RepID=A0A6F8VFN1_9PROT|nr:DUF3330 domain-containing protein [Sulfurimicrobium lacus]BCB27529.1 hypothetical protein SKTS_24150 [Sulfurimicrobium lacus]